MKTSQWDCFVLFFLKRKRLQNSCELLAHYLIHFAFVHGAVDSSNTIIYEPSKLVLSRAIGLSMVWIRKGRIQDFPICTSGSVTRFPVSWPASTPAYDLGENSTPPVLMPATLVLSVKTTECFIFEL